MDTIFALTSARGRAGVAVVRISGPGAKAALAAFSVEVAEPRHAALRDLKIDGELVDQALVLWFKAGASFTGETVAELHLHGSPAIVAAVLGHLAGLADTRMAEPGEFTRRALMNDRMDLTQVEGLGALIEAETEAQRRQAQRVFSGALGGLAERWRRDLIRAASLLEVTIDFVDEDVPLDVGPEVVALLSGVRGDMVREIDGSRIAERIRDGFEVAIIGAPNTGKSTLLNALAGRDAAITSEIAGTTRDVIEVRMDLRGLPVTFLDTAGLRVAADEIERLGVARAQARAKNADLRVLLLSDEDTPDMVELFGGDIKIWGKADLRDGGGRGVSGLTGAGIDQLIGEISDVLGRRVAGAATATHARHRAAIRAAEGALAAAGFELEEGPGRVELAAEEVRSAIRALDGLVGRVDVENLLDEIFSSFCLGK